MAETAENIGVDVNNTTNEPEVDYKSLYEALKKDNSSLEKYNQDLKAKYQAKLTDEEKLKAQNEERESYYKKLERELSFSKYKNGLASRVTDENALNEIANKFADGDSLSALDLLVKFETNREDNLKKGYEQDLLAKNPTPPPASENTLNEISQKQFDKMNYNERVELKNKDPELYEKLAKK